MLTASETEMARDAGPELSQTTEPHPATGAAPIPRRWPRLRLSTTACLAVSVVTFLITIVLANLSAPRAVVTVFGTASLVLFALTTLVALFRAVAGAIALARPTRATAAGGVSGLVLDILGNLLLAAFGMLIAFFATVGFSRGRQLRRLGRVLLPSLRQDSAWASCAMALDGQGAPAEVADRWRENGKTEHASVAAFARLTLDLMALGAPPRLIAAANQDALDEIRHTELCFSLARAIDGKTVSPGPFPEAQRVATLPRARPLALAKLAVDSLIDGALHEGVSARIIAKLAPRAEVQGIRAALKEIAADEGRHAAHGWAVVDWCLDEGGSAVGAALLGALRVVPREMRSELPEPASDGGWERWGIHGHRLESEEYGAALAHLTERVHGRVARLASRAA
jgi:hypothetical protein